MKKFILLLSIFFISGCSVFHNEYKIPKDVVIKTNEITKEVFSTLDTKELISEANVEITNHKEITLESIGEKTYTVQFNYKDKPYKYKIKYNVVDTVKPMFLSVPSSKTILLGDDYYPCDSTNFADNYDSEPTCTVIGDYDLTTVGTYKVKYSLKDSSNNEITRDLTINVVDKIPEKKPSKPAKKVTLPISDVIKKHKNKNTLIGIDVSRWQTDIDFEKVKNAGVEFVIMRIGVQSDNDKDLSMDTYYLKNIENAKKAGLKVGVYLYTTAINPKMAKEHAKWVVDALDKTELDFPIAFDWENWSKFRKYKISLYTLNKTFDAFVQELENNNYKGMLYSSKYYLENIWTNKNDYPVWLAHYTSNTSYSGNYFLWQMSNVGRVDGINGDVDIDILYQNKME